MVAVCRISCNSLENLAVRRQSCVDKAYCTGYLRKSFVFTDRSAKTTKFCNLQ